MKNKMLMMLLLLGFVFPSGAMASTKILLFEDIGTDKASFALEEVPNGGVALSARVRNKCWDQDCEPYLLYWKSLPKDFTLQNLDVYFDNGKGPRIHCGRIKGIFHHSQILSACQIRVSPEPVCTVVNNHADCNPANTKYIVHMTIQSNNFRASEKEEAVSEPSKDTGQSNAVFYRHLD